MKPGFYTIIAAQFFSSLADNALLIAAIALLRELHEPAWMTPALKQSFVVSYVVLAPFVGAFADSMPKGRVMLITNAIKIVRLRADAVRHASAAVVRDRGVRRRRLFAGEIRHPDRAAAAAPTRHRQRLDRGRHRRLDHPRRAAGRRADHPARIRGAARLRLPVHRHADRHAAGGRDRRDHGLLRSSPRSSTGTYPTPASTTACPARIRST